MNQNEKLKTALVRFIDQDAYPDSEDVASAEVPSSILPSLLSDLQQARSDVKVWVNLRLGLAQLADGRLSNRMKSAS